METWRTCMSEGAQDLFDRLCLEVIISFIFGMWLAGTKLIFFDIAPFLWEALSQKAWEHTLAFFLALVIVGAFTAFVCCDSRRR